MITDIGLVYLETDSGSREYFCSATEEDQQIDVRILGRIFLGNWDEYIVYLYLSNRNL